MSTFINSLLMVGISELGDKTQLLVLAFAARCSIPNVVAGMTIGVLATNFLAALVGSVLGLTLPVPYVKLVAGIVFIAFAVWTWFGKEEDEEAETTRQCISPWAVASAFFAAELADKTQLATLTLAANYHSFFPVWIGASLGMFAAIGLAIVVGQKVGDRLPARPLRLFSGLIFLAFGIISLIAGIRSL